MIRKDVEFVTGPGLDIEPGAMERVGNLLTALQDAEAKMDQIEAECNDDDRSPAAHAREAQKLEEAAREAAKNGDEKLAAAFRTKAEFHHEEVGRPDASMACSPICGPRKQPKPPRKPGRSVISDMMTR